MRQEVLISLVLSAAVCAGACSRAGARGSVTASQGGSLTGRVTSEAEGPMEGVLVSAKLAGGNMTVTVVSDTQGRYAFPAGRLKPGKYRLAIRAAGYDLEDPGMLEVGANQTEKDLKLSKTRDLAPQLMNTEWLMSIAGTPEQKSGVELRLDLLDKDRCTICHSLWFVTRNGHDASEWVGVLNRMRYHHPGSTPINPDDQAASPRLKKFWGPAGKEPEGPSQNPAFAVAAWDYEEGAPPASIPKRIAEQAAYLATINLSSAPTGTWKYPLRTLPRPKGNETKVIVTEYDMPRSVTQPHDAAVDSDGMIWYQDFGHNFTGHHIGRLDPRTGQFKEWRVPALRPYPPFGTGGLDVRIDWEGNPWFAIWQSSIMKFDKRTEQMTFWRIPGPETLSTTVDMMIPSPSTGMVWFEEESELLHGIDLKTGWITKTIRHPGGYGMGAFSNGNLVRFQFAQSVVHEVDTKTGKTTTYPTPTPNAGARRGNVDTQDRAWFGEYLAGKFAMFDSKTKQIKEWPIPVPNADPYDVILDKNGLAWGGGMLTDYVFRLNPETGQVTKYLLPTVNANIRRIDVDNKTTPVSVWVGETHQGKIARVEVLEDR